MHISFFFKYNYVEFLFICSFTGIYTLFLFPGGKSSFDNDRIVKLVASLSVQVCRLNPPFCKELHEKQATMESAMHHSVLREREMELQVDIQIFHSHFVLTQILQFFYPNSP